MSRKTPRQRSRIKRIIARKSQAQWAVEIFKNIKNDSLRRWVASVVWWNSGGHLGDSPSKGRLYNLMNDCKGRDITKDEDLEEGLRVVGLVEEFYEEERYMSMLTDAEIKFAEWMFNEGFTQKDVAKELCVSQNCISEHRIYGVIQAKSNAKLKRRIYAKR